MRSVPCDFERHEECDGLVHFVPVSRGGRDLSHIPETERPRDLQPVVCSCKCHGRAIATAKPIPLQEATA